MGGFLIKCPYETLIESSPYWRNFIYFYRPVKNMNHHNMDRQVPFSGKNLLNFAMCGFYLFPAQSLIILIPNKIIFFIEIIRDWADIKRLPLALYGRSKLLPISKALCCLDVALILLELPRLKKLTARKNRQRNPSACYAIFTTISLIFVSSNFPYIWHPPTKD